MLTCWIQTVLQMVNAELQSLANSNHPPQRQMRIIATGLLALNLASITGVRLGMPRSRDVADPEQRKSRIAQAEKLYNDLISVRGYVSLAVVG